MASKQKSYASGSITKIQLVLLVVVIATALYYIKGLLVAAVVNGDPVTRLAVVKELEKEQGKAALDWLVTKKLILQEARRRKVTVIQKEIDEDFVKLEQSLVAQGQSLDQALGLQGLSKENFRERIKIAKLIEKMFEKEVTVSDKEIDAFLEKNKESISAEADQVKLRESVKQQLKSQKIDEKGNELLKKLKKEAKIYTFVNY